VEDEVELRHVFFGEMILGTDDNNNNNTTTETENFVTSHTKYAILCHDETSNIPVSSVFQEAFADGTAPAQFRLLDCNHILPSSEKTIAERFQLNLKQRPTIFVTGIDNHNHKNSKGEEIIVPKQVPTKHLKTGSMLVKALKNLLEPKAIAIQTTQDLRAKCLDTDICAVLLKGSKTSPSYVKDAMTKLIQEYSSSSSSLSRGKKRVTFGVVDTTVLYLKNVEEYLPEFVTGQPRFVIFQKVIASDDDKQKKKKSGGAGAGADRLKTSISFLPTAGVSYGPMSNLLDSVLAQTATVQKISSLPTIKTRTKKLEQEERAKRDRKKKSQEERNSQQQQQQQKDETKKNSGSGSSNSGAFSANDGSAEGRRLERERRRVEHLKQNPNYKERTPEEIAEMERKRRQRMEEEAARWNIVDGDIDTSSGGSGGSGSGSGSGSDYQEEDYDFDEDDDDDDGDDENDKDKNGNEDDDVLDLD
jgi:hypothetical protein